MFLVLCCYFTDTQSLEDYAYSYLLDAGFMGHDGERGHWEKAGGGGGELGHVLLLLANDKLFCMEHVCQNSNTAH